MKVRKIPVDDKQMEVKHMERHICELWMEDLLHERPSQLRRQLLKQWGEKANFLPLSFAPELTSRVRKIIFNFYTPLRHILFRLIFCTAIIHFFSSGQASFTSNGVLQ